MNFINPIPTTEEYEKQSLFMQSTVTFTSSPGRKYLKPSRHLCLTSYPIEVCANVFDAPPLSTGHTHSDLLNGVAVSVPIYIALTRDQNKQLLNAFRAAVQKRAVVEQE